MEQIEIPMKFVAKTLMNTFKGEDYDKLYDKSVTDGNVDFSYYREMIWLLHRDVISTKIFKEMTKLYLNTDDFDVIKFLCDRILTNREIYDKLYEMLKGLDQEEIFDEDCSVKKRIVSKLMSECNDFHPFKHYEQICEWYSWVIYSEMINK